MLPMLLLSSLLFGISASLDALLVGISMGIRKVRISFWHNLLISMITLVGTCLSIELGIWILPLLPATFSRLLGCSVLILFGCYYIIKSMKKHLKKFLYLKPDTPSQPTPPSQPIAVSFLSIQECCLLGIALSANNMGIGFSASIAGLSLIPTAIATLSCSVLFLAIGCHMGQCHRLQQMTDTKADFLSGLLIICLGFASLLF